MKITRKSYIQTFNNNEKITTKILLALALAIILVLLISLYISNVIGLYEVTREPSIAKRTAEANVLYGSKINEIQDLENELTGLQQLKRKQESENIFYNAISNLIGLRIQIAQELNTSLDKKGFLKDKKDYIFVNKNGNLVLLDLMIFSGNESSELTDSAKEATLYLSAELEKILDNQLYSKFIKYISIESYVDKNDNTIASKVLANQRSYNFLNQILNDNVKLKEKYSDKFISSNCYSNSSLDLGDLSDSRIEICVYIDDGAIAEALSEFIGSEN